MASNNDRREERNEQEAFFWEISWRFFFLSFFELVIIILNENEFNIEGLNLIKSDETHILEINFEGANPEKMALLIDQLRKLDSIKEVNWSQ